ncbi:MAG: triose-phosphate isomerase [Arcobacteraceae bacterium]
MPIIAANFKTNHTRASTALYVASLTTYLKTNNTSEVYLFPSVTALDTFETPTNFTLGVQNAYPTKNGSFTGEIGTEQLDEFNIKTILIGHSERRHILGEMQESIAKKYQYFKALNYKIIYCFGEPLEVKNQGQNATLEYIWSQFEGIDTAYDNLILAYEPVWAIGTGVSATLEDIEQIHTAIKKAIPKPLLYGGSVNLGNVEKICAINNVDGALIGTASWVAEDFIKIIENTKEL